MSYVKKGKKKQKRNGKRGKAEAICAPIHQLIKKIDFHGCPVRYQADFSSSRLPDTPLISHLSNSTKPISPNIYDTHSLRVSNCEL